MAIFYSNHFAPDAQSITAKQSSYRASVDLSHARVRKKIAKINMDLTGAADDDEFVLAKFKSSDVLYGIWGGWDDGGTALVLDVGLSPVNPDGTPGTSLDPNLYASGLDGAAAADRLEAFTDGALGGSSRGLPIWESYSGEGPGALTVDPKVEYYIVAVATTALTTADNDYYFEFEYTSGD